MVEDVTELYELYKKGLERIDELETELLLVRTNWVRITVLTNKKGLDPRSPEFKRIKKELEYRSKVMYIWSHDNKIPDDYHVPPLDDNTNIKY